ncbi:MAG TPA: hypothetical protein VE262_16945 [Blastocatellia bacterium]|nr:hypothetical protein [Blastocatellia bacterium]
MNDPGIEATEDIKLDRYFAAVWRAKWLILIGALAAAAATYLLSRNQPVTYNATANLEIGRVWREPLADYYLTAETINSAGFLRELSEKTGLRANLLRRSVRAEAIEGGPRRERYPILVRITASSESAEEAAQIAEAVASEVIARHDKLFNDAMSAHVERERGVEKQLEELRAQPSPAARDSAIRLEATIAEIKSNTSSPTITRKSRMMEERVISSAAGRPPAWRGVTASALIAALVLTAASALFDHLRPSHKGKAAGKQT